MVAASPEAPRAGRAATAPAVRVLHLINGLESGGAEMMLLKLLSGTDRSRFAPEVVSLTGEGVLGERVRELGFPLYPLGIARGSLNPGGILRLARLLRRRAPDVLQSWLYHADLSAVLATRLVRAPALAWNIRCSRVEEGHYSRLTTLLPRVLARVSAVPRVVVVNSESGRSWHTELGYAPRRWEVIPNGFDTERFRPDPAARVRLRGALGIPDEAPVVGLVARYDPMKDHAGFLRAASRVRRVHPETSFVLAGRGAGADNPELAGLVRDLGLGGAVHLLGERADVAAVYPALDVLALASAFGEGFPNVVGEAMSCGVPCVVTDVGDAAAVVGGTGRVVPPRDPERLAAALTELLTLGPERRRELGLAARRRIEEEFGLASVIARYENLYEELAADVRHRRIL